MKRLRNLRDFDLMCLGSARRATSGNARFSRAVICGNKARFWNTIAKFRSAGGSSGNVAAANVNFADIGCLKPEK